MLSRTLYVVVITGLLTMGLTRALRGDPVALLWWLAAGALLYYRRRTGEVNHAFSALRRGDLAAAKKHLDRTRLDRLDASGSAKYRWVQAALAEAAGRRAEARAHLEAALDTGGLHGVQRSLCLGTLATVCLAEGDRARATQVTKELEERASSARERKMAADLRARL